MSLKHRVDRLEERLNPNPEKVEMTLPYQFLPDDMEWIPEAFQPGINRVSRHLVVVFIGGTERMQREKLRRLQRDPRYQRDPWANRPNPALAADQEAEEKDGRSGGASKSDRT